MNDHRLNRVEALVADATELVTELRNEMHCTEKAWQVLSLASDQLNRAAGQVAAVVREC